MKRYVKELRNDLVSRIAEDIMNCYDVDTHKMCDALEEIGKAMWRYENGYALAYEAVESMIQSYRKAR